MTNLIKILLSVLFLGIITTGAKAQRKNVKTTEFEVKGVCGMCKNRIENASLIKGVKFSEYDVETHVLKVVYRSDKTDVNDIHKSIAKSGHTTEKVEADPKAYAKLPACCLYADPDNPHLQDPHKGHNH